MVQWTKFERIKKFVNPMQLHITCEKSGGLHLAEPGLTAGRQAEKIWVMLENLTVCCRPIFCFV